MQFVTIRAIGVFECAALLVSLLVPIAQMHAQTQATMNAQAHAEFARADAEFNKTCEALLAKLPDAEAKALLWSKFPTRQVNAFASPKLSLLSK
jgi:hypothetical protein